MENKVSVELTREEWRMICKALCTHSLMLEKKIEKTKDVAIKSNRQARMDMADDLCELIADAIYKEEV